MNIKKHQQCMALLGKAWSQFLEIYNDAQPVPQLETSAYKPSVTRDDLEDFRKAIHDAQRIVGCIVAQRVAPEVFNDPKPDKDEPIHNEVINSIPQWMRDHAKKLANEIRGESSEPDDSRPLPKDHILPPPAAIKKKK